MRFGTIKKDVQEASNDSDWLRSFRSGETKVRFLDECEDWILYREHYMNGKSFPCTQDRNTCPGCTSENENESRSSRKYATNVLMPETGYVVPIKMPVTLVNRLVTRSERNNGTITSRDYVVIKDGKGLETSYDVEQDDKYEVDIQAMKRQAKDIESILQKSYAEVWGELPDEKPAAKPSRASKAKAVEASEDEEIPFDRASVKEADEEISEEAVRRMTKRDLVALARRAGVRVDENDQREDIIEDILASLDDA